MINLPVKSLVNSVWVCLSILSLSGCAKHSPDKNCSEKHMEEMATFYQGEFSGKVCTVQGVNENNPVQNVIIKNRADYEKYIKCSLSAPDIDFEKFVVLATRYKHHQCAVLSGQKVELCNDSRFIYTVEISEQVCLAPTSVFGFAVIEKRNKTLPVEFKYNLKKE